MSSSTGTTGGGGVAGKPKFNLKNKTWQFVKCSHRALEQKTVLSTALHGERGLPDGAEAAGACGNTVFQHGQVDRPVQC